MRLVLTTAPQILWAVEKPGALPRPTGIVKVAHAARPSALWARLTQPGAELPVNSAVRVRLESGMPDRDKQQMTEAPSPWARSEGLGQAVELARKILRERGLNDQQIDVLLKRPKAPTHLN